MTYYKPRTAKDRRGLRLLIEDGFGIFGLLPPKRCQIELCYGLEATLDEVDRLRGALTDIKHGGCDGSCGVIAEQTLDEEPLP